MSETVMQVLDRVAREQGARPAMKVKRDGQWHATSWNEYRALARRVARGFIKLGLGPSQGVSIIGYNCPQWLLADIGAILAGGVPAGIYTTSSPEQCQYITDHCDAAVAVVENEAHLAKFKEVRGQLPKLRAIVMMFGSDPDPDVHSWDELLAMGDSVAEADLDARSAAQKATDMATLIYTSGTTGPPKAVMISHTNLTFTARAVCEAVKLDPGNAVMSYLPLSHVAEQIVSVHAPMSFGGCTAFAESIDKLGENLREIRPDLFFAVPRVWEKMQAKIQSVGAKNPPLKKKIGAWGRGVGLKGGFAEQRGEAKPLLYGLADALVFSKVRQALGLDRSRLQITSAAPISRDTLEFFLSLGIPIYEVYGMSECTGPTTISLPGRYKTGKAGFALPGTELKIAADGEVCMRGDHIFLGYLKNEEATREALDADGWLHSGDIGEIDADGFLQITDRKKDLLITAGGENIAPQVIEGKLKGIPVVAQAVVIGDRRRFLAALLTLDPEKIESEAAAAGSPARDVESAAACPTFHAHLRKQVDALNETLARVQTIKKFVIVPQDFTIEGGELTPTMKVKRKVVNQKYAAQIEALYVE